MASTRTQAVLTGDLIASTGLPPAQTESAMAALRSAADASGTLHFTRFRGDGWQVLLPHPQSALRTAFRLTAALAAAETGLATRIAIGFGTARPGTGLADATGTAFTRSGRALDHMPRKQRWAISGGPDLPAWIPATIALAEWHAARWTAGQAAVVAEWLDPADRTQEDRATRMGLTRQAWKARFDGSGIGAWQPALDLWDRWKGDGVHD